MKTTNNFKLICAIYFMICLIGINFCHAQTDTSAANFIGIRFGAGPTNIATNTIDMHENDLGVSISIAFEHLQKNKLNWSIGLQSEIKGYVSDLLVLNAMGQIVDVGSDPVSVDYPYIGVPKKIGFMTGQRLYKFGDFGICPSYHVSTTYTYDEINFSDFPPGSEVVAFRYEEMPFHNFDFSTFIELGLGYELSDRFHLYLSIQGQYSLTNLAKDYHSTSPDPVARHYGFSVNLGARFKAKRK